MNNVIIGTAGHVDHGKTCLIKALTGVETDRLIEEKKRGITIELGFAYLDTPDGDRIGIIDVPGHEKFISNMLAGAGGIDLALLVVAADEGVMPQTAEHLGILSLLGIGRGIIVMTKCDLADADWRAMIAEDIRGRVAGTFLENAPIIEVSAHTGSGIEDLRSAIIQTAGQMSGKKMDSAFRIPVDRVFTVEGFGTVITGTMIEGSLGRGDEVVIYPGGDSGKVRNIQVHSQSVDRALAGQRVAVNFSNLKKTDLQRGDVVAPPGSMHTSMMLDVRLNALEGTGRIIKNNSRLHFYHGAREVLCKAVLLDTDELHPGQSCYAQLRMEELVAVKAGDHYIVRFYSPLETLGGGIILDPAPQKRRRNDEAVLRGLAVKEHGDFDARLEQAVSDGSPMFCGLDYLCVQHNLDLTLAHERAEALAAEGKLAKVSDGLYLHSSYTAKQGEALSGILRKFHTENPLRDGMKKEELRSRFLPGQIISVADGLLAYYEAAKRIKAKNGLISLFNFNVKLDDTSIKLMNKIEKAYLDAGYSPAPTEEILQSMGNDSKVRQVFSAMISAGTLVRADDAICFHKAHYQAAADAICDLARQQGQITLAQCRDLLGTSRKYAVSILETLDREKVTQKVGDYRVLR